jgi:hypothetical protein
VYVVDSSSFVVEMVAVVVLIDLLIMVVHAYVDDDALDVS